MSVSELERFQEPIQKVNWINQGSVFILNEENGVLASTKDIRLPSSISYGQLSGKSGTVAGWFLQQQYLNPNV
ncbi:hypothetical protein GC096_11155 [Paenibacillus sp. LMG 31461]|uniref:Uncharacterized protein n=1 Tax=Paenibacillus plantarum TaxID=2654975 RepID=A0ABX1X819_9BACL|nr:hypothetical protein [Paenibacillus plantarum]NOU64588.1 hypothetical protein [Paenibacillus plantarum]